MKLPHSITVKINSVNLYELLNKLIKNRIKKA